MSHVALVGVPLDLGAGRRGTDMGPSAVRYTHLQAGLESLGCRVTDLGNVSFSVPEQLEEGNPRARYADAIVRVCEEVDRATSSALRQGALPLVVGGDHSLSLGSFAAVVRQHPEVGLLWLDAHGDFNTPETSRRATCTAWSWPVYWGSGFRSWCGWEGSGRSLCRSGAPWWAPGSCNPVSGSC